MNKIKLPSRTDKRFVPYHNTQKTKELELEIDQGIEGSVKQIRNSGFVQKNIWADDDKERGLTALHVSSGIGKTHAMREYCVQNPSETILVVVQDQQMGQQIEKKLENMGRDCQRIKGFQRAGCPLMPKYDGQGEPVHSRLTWKKRTVHEFWKKTRNVGFTHNYAISSFSNKAHNQHCPYIQQYEDLDSKVIIVPVDLIQQKQIWNYDIDRAFVDEAVGREEKFEFNITESEFEDLATSIENTEDFQKKLDGFSYNYQQYSDYRKLVRRFISDFRTKAKQSSALFEDGWKPGYYSSEDVRDADESPLYPDPDLDKEDYDNRLIWQVRSLNIIDDYDRQEVAEAMRKLGKLYKAVMFDQIEGSPSTATSTADTWINLENLSRHVENLFTMPEWFCEKIEKKSFKVMTEASQKKELGVTQDSEYGKVRIDGEWKPYNYNYRDEEVWISNFGCTKEEHAGNQKPTFGTVSYRKKPYMMKVIEMSNNCHFTILDASFKKNDLEELLNRYIQKEIGYKKPRTPKKFVNRMEPVHLYIERKTGREMIQPYPGIHQYNSNSYKKEKEEARLQNDYTVRIARAKTTSEECPSEITLLSRKHYSGETLPKFSRNSALYEKWMESLKEGNVPDLLRDLCNLVKRGNFPDFGLITHKPLAQQLVDNGLLNDSDVGHFWGLRGMNNFENKSGLFVLGTPFISPNAMLFDTTTRYGKISSKPASKNKGMWKYPIPHEQDIFELSTHEEVYQAVMRGRPHDYSMDIYLLGYCPMRLEEEVGVKNSSKNLSDAIRDSLFEATKNKWKRLTADILRGQSFELEDLKQRYPQYSEDFLHYVMKRLGRERKQESMKKVKLKESELSRKENYSYDN